jgi:hypothetical protein
MKLIMRNKANFQKSQMFITSIKTIDYNEKSTLDTWSKRTQSNPIYGEPVEPTKPNSIYKNWLVLYWQVNREFDNLTNNKS